MSRALRTLLLALVCAGGAQAQSLFQEDAWRGFTADNKAYRPGDVLTVQVFENSSASSSADTGTRRANHMAAELAHGSNKVAQTNLVVAGDFDGGGRTQRASRLLATLTVTVQEVLPGGQLRVAGAQSVTVNEELQRVTLEGVVRPSDISDGNVVQSTRIAQARITYVGEGDLTERNRRAWWRRLLDAVGF
ncbi:flagellar basal body L-ring protein FlgH [Ramlibacter sp. USB13]|uniref:Flagellar L-ring protein n=1 Tax=Ramlibacter cellulosilyticus TaxID=2764187 RepID=A0A923MTR5_9BURK|nr:flagellar basal body L-ring protein FlgH [Ramlibacter cellulosilyticus]MBC5785093.1 flagellar basal body L-ring protein FlgH [Ramlibacter cellulosilyticus]